jgi:TctA family transporter
MSTIILNNVSVIRNSYYIIHFKTKCILYNNYFLISYVAFFEISGIIRINKHMNSYSYVKIQE